MTNLGAVYEAELFRFVYLRSDFVLGGKGKGALTVVTCVQSVPDVADDILSFSRVFLKILPSPPCSEQCVLQLNPSVQ